jgi:hypothetical protein
VDEILKFDAATQTLSTFVCDRCITLTEDMLQLMRGLYTNLCRSEVSTRAHSLNADVIICLFCDIRTLRYAQIVSALNERMDITKPLVYKVKDFRTA